MTIRAAIREPSLPRACVRRAHCETHKDVHLTGDSVSPAQPALAASSSTAGSSRDGVDVLLAWEAASPLDESPCRGYSHLYGLRLQVRWRAARAAAVYLAGM